MFDGEKKEAYVEDDPTHPLGVYGQSKYAGEEAIQEVGDKIISLEPAGCIRTIGHNFFLTMKKLSQERDELKVVADQIGVPTSTHLSPSKSKPSSRSLMKIIPGSIIWCRMDPAPGMSLLKQLLAKLIQSLI